jgi:transcriptional regulator GlxA family with amidase domain
MFSTSFRTSLRRVLRVLLGPANAFVMCFWRNGEGDSGHSANDHPTAAGDERASRARMARIWARPAARCCAMRADLLHPRTSQLTDTASFLCGRCGKLGHRSSPLDRSRIVAVTRRSGAHQAVIRPQPGANASMFILDKGHGMKVAIVVFDGVQALDVAGPMDVFAEANASLPEHQRYQVVLVGSRAGTVTCSNGMQLSVPFGYEDFDVQCDLLLVAGGPQLPDTRLAPAFVQWLQAQARSAARYGSVCNGAFVLGHAGLLDGQQATTHWADAERLAAEFPRAHVQPDRIFTRDGRLFTSAGVTAGIDLCLSLVGEDWGHELAVRVAKRLVVYIQREGGQSQYSPYVGIRADDDTIIGKVHRYVIEHIADALSIEQLAKASAVSRRTFSRLFAKYAKVTPSAFVEQVRVDAARKLLEETDAPLKTVAFNCGFHSATHMRTTFSRRLNVTPKAYRERFRGAVSETHLALHRASERVEMADLEAVA